MENNRRQETRLDRRENPQNLKLIKDDEPDLLEYEFDDHFDRHQKKEEGEGPWLISYADLMTLLVGFFALIASFSKPDIKMFEEVKKSATKEFGGTYSEPYKKLEETIKQAIQDKGVAAQVSVTRGAEGVAVKFDGKMLFDSGDFAVKQEGATVINGIMDSLKTDIPKYKATIEGHTDNVPITHPIISSNWELSAIRAARIAQLMEVKGFHKEQLTIQGWGETKPELPNVDAQGNAIPENQAKNRRVIMKISDK